MNKYERKIVDTNRKWLIWLIYVVDTINQLIVVNKYCWMFLVISGNRIYFMSHSPDTPTIAHPIVFLYASGL